MDTINQLILILGGYTVVLTGLFVFIGNNIINKLKINWETKSQSQLSVLKGEIERNNNLVSHILTSHSNSFNLGNTKKVECLDFFWKTVMEVKGLNRLTNFLYSFLLDKEIEKLYTEDTKENLNIRSTYLSAISQSHEDTSKKAADLRDEIDKRRPFIGETLYSLYYFYSLFLLRSSYLLIKDSSLKKCNPWKSDQALINNLKNLITESELNFIISKDFGSYDSVIYLIETKMINAISYSLNGEEAIDNTIKQVEKIESLAKIGK